MESDTEQNETIPYADESEVHENLNESLFFLGCDEKNIYI